MVNLGAEHENLDQKVYETLRNMIIERQILPGEKISQEKLTQELGISRTPLVSALKFLEHEKLVASKPRRGYFVRLFSSQEMVSIFELREVLEGLAAKRAASNITEKEIETIAAYIHTDPDTFVENYCQISGGKRILAQVGDMYCIFWDGLCTIHPVKPRMCKTWPFIESILVDTSNWYIMASLCPGIRTDVPNRIIKKCVTEKLSRNL